LRPFGYNGLLHDRRRGNQIPVSDAYRPAAEKAESIGYLNFEIRDLISETAGSFSGSSMFLLNRSSSVYARIMVAGTWGLFCAMILAAPILLSRSFDRAASVLYFTFSIFCHQIPDRSYSLLGYSLPVCHRCLGIYLGLWLGSLIENRFAHRSPQARREWIFAACAPMLFDAILSYSGLWRGSGNLRFLTGLWFGCLISTLLVRGIEEFLMDARRRRLAAAHSSRKKGYSWIQKECGNQH
jgi:uncharacterized membrane protein